MISLSLQLMLYGLIGVFAVLLILYLAIKLIVKIFPSKDEDDEE